MPAPARDLLLATALAAFGRGDNGMLRCSNPVKSPRSPVGQPLTRSTGSALGGRPGTRLPSHARQCGDSLHVVVDVRFALQPGCIHVADVAEDRPLGPRPVVV